MACRGEKKLAIFHDKIEVKSGILKILSNAVIFTDETTVEVDSIIFCTGKSWYKNLPSTG